MDNFTKLDIEHILSKFKLPSLQQHVVVIDELHKITPISEPVKCDCLFIGICTKGYIRSLVNQKDMTVTSGNAFIIVQGQVIENTMFSSDMRGYGFFIDYSFVYEIVKDVQNLSALFLLARNHPVFPLMPRELSSAEEYVKLIKNKITGPRFKYLTDVVRLLLLTLIYDMGSAFYRVMEETSSMSRNTKAERFFVHFIQLVENHHCEERRVSWYAEKIGISAKYLSEIISSVSKRSPNDWIDKYVTTEIKNQLRKTDKKISEIASDLNFQNQSFMGKYFRENVGISPSQYRHGMEPTKK